MLLMVRTVEACISNSMVTLLVHCRTIIMVKDVEYLSSDIFRDVQDPRLIQTIDIL